MWGGQRGISSLSLDDPEPNHLRFGNVTKDLNFTDSSFVSLSHMLFDKSQV